MTRAISQDLLWYGYWKRKTVTITVVPTPPDATVTLSASGCTQSGNSIVVPIGAVLSWSVAKTPTYNTQSGQFVVTGPNTMNVELSSAQTGILSISPIPSDSVVMLTAPGCTQVGNAITVPLGTTVHCVVSPNNGADLLESSTDIQVVRTEQSATLYCNARVTLSPTPSDSAANITYAGRTYSTTTIVPYDSRISWSVSHSGYDSQSANNVQILANTTIPVTLQKTMVTFSVTPYIKGTYASNATVSLSTDASGVDPISGTGAQQITIPAGSSVTYSVSQTNYDTVIDIAENITSATNISVTIVPHIMGVQYFASDTSWTVPTSDDYKIAIITNGGNGGSSNSVKQIGGIGGGASGNAYVVDAPNLVAGQVLAFTFGSNNTIITKNGSDYLSYPNGGNGVSSSVNDVTFTGTAGGSASAGAGGGGGSGGVKRYIVVIPHTTCVGSSCHTTYSRINYTGVINPGGDGGADGNNGVTGGASTGVGAADGGAGGTGINSATGGGNNGAVYPNATGETSIPGVGGSGGTGASGSQSAITARAQAGTLTSAFLRSLISAGGAGTGGVYGSNDDYTTSTTIATPGAGGGGGAWTDGEKGNDGTASVQTSGVPFANVVGGTGGHGVIIIWRPADFAQGE